MKVSAAGALTVVAGNGKAGFAGDGGPATSASLNQPGGVAVDGAGNLYIADWGNGRIRKVSLAGTITTVAGNGTLGFSGDGGPATGAALNSPTGVAADAAGNLYIADRGNRRIRAVTRSGTIITVAGNGQTACCLDDDGSQATSVPLLDPRGVAVDAGGNVYIADIDRIRKVSLVGIITTVGGTGSVYEPTGVAVDAAGNVYVSQHTLIRRISIGGASSVVVTGGSYLGFSGDGSPATQAQINGPTGVAVDAAGNLYIADADNHRIRRVDSSGIITTMAGNGAYKFGGDDGPATSASLNQPWGVALDAAGNLFVADGYNNRVRKVSPAGVISTVAGSREVSFAGDGGPATTASLRQPAGVALDATGNLYVTDNSRVRRVDPSGTISTVAGGGAVSGLPQDSGDDGPATRAALGSPSGVAVDAAGNLYIADRDHNRVRKVDPSGTIRLFAGAQPARYYWPGFSGDGGPATSAWLSGPMGVAVDLAGNVYIADTGNNRVRKVNPSGIITTVAGAGTVGAGGDGGPATGAGLNHPTGVAVDSAGNVYIADTGNNRIRKVSPTGTITTVAGNGAQAFSGDGGPPSVASLNHPLGVAVDAAGNVYITDSGNDRIRKVVTAGPPGGGGTGGQISAAGVTNAASFVMGLTPGSIVSIFGVGIAKGVSGILLGNSLPLPTILGGVSVWIGQQTVPLFAVANVKGQEQINLQVPWEITGQTTVSIQVNANGVWSNAVQVPVLQAHPGIFTLDGKAGAVLHSLGNALVSVFNPAGPNEIITIYAAGLGPVSPAPPTGYPAPSREPLARTSFTPAVTIGGISAPVLFSGLAPGLVGLYQVNVQVPAATAPGDAVPVAISQGGLASNIATISVH